MKNNKAAIYERLSKEDFNKLKSDESMSIEGQRMINTSFCKFNKIEIVKDYVDDGYSGSNFDRPAFREMIRDIENGLIDCVITKDFSRLGRELYQTGTYIEDYFNEKRVRYIAINDGYDSSKETDGFISMKLTFNDYTLRDTSRKVKSSLTARKQNGQYIGSIPKYGYLKDPNDHHHLIPDPVASLVVKRIYNMALNGNGCCKIARQLSDEKVPIPIVYKKESRGALVTENDGFGIWRKQTIKDILTSEMYLGTMVQNMFEKVRYNSKKIRKLDKDEYIKVENTHEPIIERDVFDKVQKILKSLSKQPLNKEPNRFLFGGLLYCKECGHKLSIRERHNKGNNPIYTQCNLFVKKGRYGLCNNHLLDYKLLEEDLLTTINDICSSFLKEYSDKSLKEEATLILNEQTEKIQKDIDSLSKEITKYNRAIENLYLDKMQEKIPINVYDGLLKTYNDSLKNAEKDKEYLKSKKTELITKIKSLDYGKCAEYIKKYLSTENPSRELIMSLVNKVEVDNEKNIKLFFTFAELTSYAR